MANTTLSSLKTKTRQELKLDRLGKIWDSWEVGDAIQEALTDIENKGNFRWQENETEVSFNSVASTMEYDMETNIPSFQAINLVQYDDKTLKATTYKELKRTYSDFLEGTPTHYYIYNGNIWFHPYPVDVKVIDVTYTKHLTLPSTDTDTSPLPTDFDKAITLYAAYSLLMKPADGRSQQKAFAKLNMYKDVIGRLINSYLIPDRENMWYKSNYVPRQARTSYRSSRFRNI